MIEKNHWLFRTTILRSPLLSRQKTMKLLLVVSYLALCLPSTTLALVEKNLRTQQEDKDSIGSPSDAAAQMTTFEQPKVHPFKRKTVGENPLELHPMYRMEPVEQEEEEVDAADLDPSGERNLQSQSVCSALNLAVRPSEYDVDYQTSGDIQYGATPIYRPDNMNVQVGTWYWEWIDDSYGTMMVYWNKKESIFFGFHSSQEYYPIAGGHLKNNNCPGGYVAFMKWNGDDIRQYQLNICSGCPGAGRARRSVSATTVVANKAKTVVAATDPDPIKRGVN